MTITINGEQHTLVNECLVETLNTWGASPPFSVAINQQFIPKHQWATVSLKPGDAIEVLTPISGG